MNHHKVADTQRQGICNQGLVDSGNKGRMGRKGRRGGEVSLDMCKLMSYPSNGEKVMQFLLCLIPSRGG